MIHFNKPNITKIDIKNLIKVCKSKFLTKTKFNSLTSKYLQKKINSKYISLTQSGSDALEVAFHLLNLKPPEQLYDCNITAIWNWGIQNWNRNKIIKTDI